MKKKIRKIKRERESKKDSCCHGRDGVIKTAFSFCFSVVERRRRRFFILVAARRRQRSGDNPIGMG
jgi:hypothetical protein